MSEAFEQLKTDIIIHAGLESPEATGFYAVYCPVCGKNDRKTGGFKLEHETIGYHCFRGKCDASCVMTLGEPISRKFRTLMDAIGVKIPVELRMAKSSIRKVMEDALDEDLYQKNVFNDMAVPEEWIPLYEAPRKNFDYWAKYFEDRCVPLQDIFFAMDGKYKGLAIVGVYFYDKLIGFQVVNPGGRVKYITLTDSDHIVYFPDRYPRDPIIVVEGLLDAKCFPNTCALFRSRIVPEQAYHLRGRDVIMLPDSSGNGFIDQFHEYGWKICIPPWKENDLNGAVQTYGVMRTAQMIMNNVYTNRIEAEARFRLWASD